MFQVNGKSLKFSLACLSDVERQEVSELITKNGGEICDERDPPSITFAGSNHRTEKEMALHVSYIHECIRHGKLIEADNFDIMDKWPKIREDKMYLPVDKDVKMQVEYTKKQEEYFDGCSGIILASEKQASGCKIKNETIKSQEKSASIALTDFIIIRRWEGGRKRLRISAENTISLNREVEEIDSLDVVTKQVETSRESKESSFNEEENLPLCQRLQRLQSSEEIDSNRDIISRQISSTNFKTQDRSARKKLSDDEPLTYDSRVRVSPRISRDDSNKEKIVDKRLIREPLSNVMESIRISSDSDVTSYDSDIQVIDNPEHGRSVDRSSLLRLRETGSEKEVSQEDKQLPGPSTETDAGGADLTKKLEENNRTAFNTIDISTDSDNERNSLICLSGSSNDDKGYSDPNSPTSSLASSLSPSSWKMKRTFARWEQREMIYYLINNRRIKAAKGYNIWKEMISDGYLPHRTYQSLNNNFRKSILPKIESFKMSPKYMRIFLKLR